jgi:ferric-dicitrate binding protein FerR (iron transport regulator)
MSSQSKTVADREAEAWYSTFSATSVSTEEIWAFGDWFRNEANRAAYDRVEKRARWGDADGPFTQAELLSALERRPDLAAKCRAAFDRDGPPLSLQDIVRELAALSGIRVTAKGG